jgi:hypothetical protein
MTAKTIYAILKKSADLLKAVDTTFTIDRFLSIEQELITPTADMVITEVAEPYVQLSAHVNGVSVADADTVAATIAPALVQLGYAVTIRPAEKTTVMTKCRTECGPSDCGQCLDGRSCDTAEDCFSTCEAGKCGTNSAATVSYIAIAIVSAFASAMLM